MRNLKPLKKKYPIIRESFTPLPHVEPHEVFERGSKPFNSDAEPRRPDYRVVDQPSSGVCGA